MRAHIRKKTHLTSQNGKKRSSQADEYGFSQSRMGLPAVHLSVSTTLKKFLPVLLSVAVSVHCPIKSVILPVSHLSLRGGMSIVIVVLVQLVYLDE